MQGARRSRALELLETTARGLSTQALVTIERDMTRELDAALATGAWRTDKKEHEQRQAWLNEIREELFHRQSGGEKTV